MKLKFYEMKNCEIEFEYTVENLWTFEFASIDIILCQLVYLLINKLNQSLSISRNEQNKSGD